MWQLHYLVKERAVTTTKVEDPLDLGKIYPLSAAIVIWTMQSGAGEDAAFADECLLEVKKDGSEVVYSENYGMAVALQNLLFPARKQYISDLGASTGPYYYIAILPFGRYLGDKEYFLDPRGWASLSLTITQPTHTATTLFNYSVIAMRSIPILEGSKGFFKFTNKRQFTASAAHEYIPLDRRHKYAAILAGEMDGASNDLDAVLDEMKVDCDAGVFEPADLREQDFVEVRGFQAGYEGTDPVNDLDYDHNYLAANWVNPWMGEDMLLDAPKYGKVELDILGLAAGTIRIAALELVKPGEIP